MSGSFLSDCYVTNIPDKKPRSKSKVNVSGFRLRSENVLFSDFVKRVYQNDGLVSIVNDMTFVEKFYPCSCDFVLDNRLSTGAGALLKKLFR
jgi:hypothetical protein